MMKQQLALRKEETKTLHACVLSLQTYVGYADSLVENVTL